MRAPFPTLHVAAGIICLVLLGPAALAAEPKEPVRPAAAEAQAEPGDKTAPEGQMTPEGSITPKNQMISGGFEVVVIGGRLSVTSRDAAFGDVLGAIANAAGFAALVSPEVHSRGITTKFGGLPIERGLRRLFKLLDIRDYSVNYGPGGIIETIEVRSESGSKPTRLSVPRTRKPAIRAPVPTKPARRAPRAGTVPPGVARPKTKAGAVTGGGTNAPVKEPPRFFNVAPMPARVSKPIEPIEPVEMLEEEILEEGLGLGEPGPEDGPLMDTPYLPPAGEMQEIR